MFKLITDNKKVQRLQQLEEWAKKDALNKDMQLELAKLRYYRACDDVTEMELASDSCYSTGRINPLLRAQSQALQDYMALNRGAV